MRVYIETKTNRKGKPIHRVMLDGGFDPTSKKRERRSAGLPPFTTKKAAEAAAVRIRHDLQQGLHVEPSKQTLAAFLEDEWLASLPVTTRASTAASYALNMRRHVVPRIGTVPLSALRATHLNGLYADLLREGRVDDKALSPRTVRYTHTILHRALRDAVKLGKLARNPADLADPPRQSRPTMKVWTISPANR